MFMINLRNGEIYVIKLKTFGSFTVGNDLTSVQEGAWRSKKLEKLFVYLAINRNRGVCIEDISKAIWQVEEETDNPVGALKNLAYRLRKALRDASFDEECIVSVRGGLYKWNDDVEVSIDVEEFDRYINEAEFAFSRSKETAIESYEKAIALYNGDFLSRLTDTHWFMTLNAFYHSRYVNTVKALAELYIDTGCYEKLEQLCTKAVVYERSDEQIYSYLILARMRTKKVQMAFDTYETAKAIMDNDLGVRKTVMLNKVYEELLSVTKGVSSYNIDEVKDDISEESMNGVFMCGYPVFKEIYHLEVRKSARSTVPESLVLVTVVPMYSSQPDKNHSHMKDSMLILERALRKCLRVGDVAAKYSDSQYIVLLSKCLCDTASDVMKRIIDRFNHTCDTHSNMTIQFDIEPVSCYSSFVTDKKMEKIYG